MILSFLLIFTSLAVAQDDGWRTQYTAENPYIFSETIAPETPGKVYTPKEIAEIDKYIEIAKISVFHGKKPEHKANAKKRFEYLKKLKRKVVPKVDPADALATLYGLSDIHQLTLDNYLATWTKEKSEQYIRTLRAQAGASTTTESVRLLREAGYLEERMNERASTVPPTPAATPAATPAVTPPSAAQVPTGPCWYDGGLTDGTITPTTKFFAAPLKEAGCGGPNDQSRSVLCYGTVRCSNGKSPSLEHQIACKGSFSPDGGMRCPTLKACFASYLAEKEPSIQVGSQIIVQDGPAVGSNASDGSGGMGAGPGQ